MMWWRVELDKSGAILKVEQVEASIAYAIAGSKHVRFVEANSKAEACSDVKAWYAKYQANRCARSKRYHEKRKAAGLCVRGGKAGRPGKKWCQKCQDLYAAYKRKRYIPTADRKPGETQYR